jgi:site-specific recombinase XerD
MASAAAAAARPTARLETTWARASELPGIQLGDIGRSKGRLSVTSKGTRARQPVPASPEALAHLATYLDEAGLPADGSRSGGPGEAIQDR